MALQQIVCISVSIVVSSIVIIGAYAFVPSTSLAVWTILLKLVLTPMIIISNNSKLL
uniref:Uncharacterized protein n=1 Tax=Anaerobacillus isosaccharinicus TaxID=1532552 RepID=A0A7S7LBX3_9BACI|nr:hypothetical protein [Anaerobacillus isosaccharinicus]QOY38065.1 hypothetical protein AWH56_011305 [Anaerobacillus isosaccharinicus]